MVNTKYNYQWKGLWTGEGYPDMGKGVLPVVWPICQMLTKTDYIPAKPEKERRTDGKFLPHPGALVYPEVVQDLMEKGMHLEVWRQNILTFLILIPEEHFQTKGYEDDMDTILTFAACDYSDPNYAMYVLEHAAPVVDSAVKSRRASIIITCDNPKGMQQYVGIWSRTTACFRLNYERLFLDVSILVKNGGKLGELEGFAYPKGDPDEMIRDFDGVSVLDVSGLWTRATTPADGISGTGVGDTKFDLDAFINSESGCKVAQASALNAMFTDCQSDELIRYFADMGVECVHHDYEGENWVSFAPLDAIGSSSVEELPCMAIFGETGLFNSAGVISIFATFYEYIRLAAQGQLIAIFFVLESADDNDLLSPILEEAAKIYPIDKSRIYLTGHSHNGRYVQEFMRRHQLQLAGVAPLSVEPGQEKNITDEQIALEANMDMPFILISGTNEVYGWFPLHSTPQNVTSDTLQGDLATADVEGRI